MAGRTLKLTPELINDISVAIRAGNYAKVAAQMVGISETTYYRWLEMADEEGTEPIYREFRESVERAEAFAEVNAIARIKQAADNGTWQAAGWLLERKYGERWGKNDKIRQEITGLNGGPVELSIDEMKSTILNFLSEGEGNGLLDSGTDTEEEQSRKDGLA